MRKVLLLTLLIFSLSFSQESFEEFKKQYLQEYQNYKAQILKEFEEYKRIVYEEFERYKKKVLKEWGEYEATDKKKWVEYSLDYKVKKVFNFEKGELRIEFKGEKPDYGTLMRTLEDFVNEDKRTAFERFEPVRRSEERLRQKIKNLKTGKISEEKVLAPIIIGKEKYSKRELRRAILSLIRKGKIYKRKLKNGKTVYVFKVKVPVKIRRNVKRYRPFVKKVANKRMLEEPLIFAIIHTESFFNPLATSPVPAYGLMQIVPKTAGLDASTLLFGKPVLLSPSFLYNAKNNIEVGGAYLYKLYYVYFKDVKNPESRLYCVIAAYNTGPGNVARAFTGTTNLKRAIRVINSMTPDEVYYTLLRKLPYDETKFYLKKVTKRIRFYVALLGG